MSEIQRLVAEAVAKRGYQKGWTAEQFAARQICKAVEELGELAEGAEWLYHTPMWVDALKDAGAEARVEFDRNSNWYQTQGINRNTLAKELPDVVIPLFVLAEEYGLDLLELVREKVTADILRGVRGGSDE